MVLGLLTLKCNMNRDLKNLIPWGNIMKRKRKAKTQDNSQTSYTKILNSLRSAISADYSKVIQKEKRAIVLGYDWGYYPVNKACVEAALAAGIFHREEVPIEAVKEHMRDEGIEKR